MMSDFLFKRATKNDTLKIIGLMREAFPSAKIYSEKYLNWLYWQNPAGEAVSFNAWSNNELVGHLAAIPQKVMLHNKPVMAILLLNVATAVSARGKGLFLDLVRQVIQLATEQGHAAIIGVANQQTYRAYVQKLEFQDVGALDAHVELLQHQIDFSRALPSAELWHNWDSETLNWRLSNPYNPLKVVALLSDSIVVEGASTLPIISARAIIPRGGLSFVASSKSYRPAVVLGMTPSGTMKRRLSINIPDRLRPSPLRLVYRNLYNLKDRIDPNSVIFSFLDFDAF